MRRHGTSEHVRCGIETRGDTIGAGARVSRGGWVGRSTRQLVRPLGPGDGPMDPSPYVTYSVYIYRAPLFIT
jgi:hypothetical protein